MDPITLAAVAIAKIIASNTMVQGVLTDAARQFWEGLTQKRPPPPTMNDLLAQQRELAVKMANPKFRLDFTDHIDYYGLLLMVTTLVTYIKRHGCVYQDFYSGKGYVYFPPPVEAPSLGVFEETGRGIIAGGEEYHFYLLIEHVPSIDQLREELNPIAKAQEEPDSFLSKLKELNAPAIVQDEPDFVRELRELRVLFGISIKRGKRQFRVANLPSEAINMRTDESTSELISQDLLSLIDLP